MAEFELNIYGANDEVTKRFETDRVRWGVYMQALELEEGLSNKKPVEQFKLMSNFIKKIFPDLTDIDLENADSEDVINTFKQFVRKAERIGGNSKNVAGVE